ncbi:hypothetical protein JGS22_014985 [Streptomyces sp. P38-E01]|uniref:Uncharacterized protein n=1 Tax=Streptomyces tardus TaxID=2780544 RepID=A0A949JMH0_9ACTN|nr:hypothetical protein [Streptomyces tardus]MBU7598884.1 hypothetical protein [Streptomyces tardus]
MAISTHWTVTHDCGHEAEHDLSARPADRRSGYARWLAARDCTDCWKASRDTDTQSTKEWLATRRAEERQAADEWAQQFAMPPLEGPDTILDWGERCRHQLMTAAHSDLVLEGTCDDTTWAELEAKARTVTRAGWWLDQRTADGTDLPELLDAASEQDRSTENPYL